MSCSLIVADAEVLDLAVAQVAARHDVELARNPVRNVLCVQLRLCFTGFRVLCRVQGLRFRCLMSKSPVMLFGTQCVCSCLHTLTHVCVLRSAVLSMRVHCLCMYRHMSSLCMDAHVCTCMHACMRVYARSVRTQEYTSTHTHTQTHTHNTWDLPVYIFLNPV
jgi:hypothetical protein